MVVDFNTLANIEPAVLFVYDMPVGTDLEFCRDHTGKYFVDVNTGNRIKSNWQFSVYRTDKNPLGTKGCTSILSIESSASRVTLLSVSRKRLYDRECCVILFRQGGYTPLHRLCGYPLRTCCPQTAWNAVRRRQVWKTKYGKSDRWLVAICEKSAVFFIPIFKKKVNHNDKTENSWTAPWESPGRKLFGLFSYIPKQR